MVVRSRGCCSWHHRSHHVRRDLDGEFGLPAARHSSKVKPQQIADENHELQRHGSVLPRRDETRTGLLCRRTPVRPLMLSAPLPCQPGGPLLEVGTMDHAASASTIGSMYGVGRAGHGGNGMQKSGTNYGIGGGDAMARWD